MFTLEHIDKSYHGLPVLLDFNLKIEKGETLLLLGETGSGKSTVARLMMRLALPDRGTIYFKGEPLESYFKKNPKAFRKSVQMLFQEASASLNPLMRMNQLVGSECELFLDLLDLHPKLLTRLPQELSVGERQRFAFLRALQVDPEFLILDEPTASLDHHRAELLLKALNQWNRRGDKTLMIISHYPAFFAKSLHCKWMRIGDLSAAEKLNGSRH